MKTLKFIITLTIIVGTTSKINAQDWHQFLGPNRDSKSPQKNLLRSWSDKQPEVLWTVDVGIGFGGPVVKSGKVYLLDRDFADECDIMRCFDLKNGKELWKFSYDAALNVPYPGSRSVPIVDDQHVYSVGPNGDLYCINIQTGKPVWNKNVWTDFGGERLPMWAISQSPLIYGNMLIVASQAPQAGVVAYNKINGSIVWKTANLGNETYVSPKVVKISGEDHLAMVTSSASRFRSQNPTEMGIVTGLDPRTGKTLWQYSNWRCQISVPCVVDAGNNKLLITGGYELGATMIQVTKKQDGTFGTSEIFTTEDFGDQTKPPLLHNGYFYAMYRTNNKRDGLVCMDMNGKIMWKTGRDPNFDRGSMILADGLILATDGMSMLYLIEPNPTVFKAISSSEVLKEGGGRSTVAASTTQNWAPIALADGILLIRDQSRMLAVKVVR